MRPDLQDGDEPGAWQLVIGLVLESVSPRFSRRLAAALENILFKVNALDPFIYTTVAALLTAVAALRASFRRGARPREPMVALRAE
jgi:hypothetical protein